ncbi:hypothetical protein TNCV_891501 [Trichonephila clavipes]|nr:hypothetical protein TNCV_891501 [Trichonephila clavipes]
MHEKSLCTHSSRWHRVEVWRVRANSNVVLVTCLWFEIAKPSPITFVLLHGVTGKLFLKNHDKNVFLKRSNRRSAADIIKNKQGGRSVSSCFSTDQR